MSEKELLKILEEDTRRECAAILENAGQEAEAIVKAAIEGQERFEIERLENAKASMDSERVRMLANARLYANEVILKERQFAIARVFEKASDRLKRVRSNKDYSKIFERLLKETIEQWRTYMKGEKGVIVVLKEDMLFLKGFNDTNCELIADEAGNMPPGIIIMSKDKKYKIVNTLDSRLEKARPELVSIIDKTLFNGAKRLGLKLP